MQQTPMHQFSNLKVFRTKHSTSVPDLRLFKGSHTCDTSGMSHKRCPPTLAVAHSRSCLHCTSCSTVAMCGRLLLSIWACFLLATWQPACAQDEDVCMGPFVALHLSSDQDIHYGSLAAFGSSPNATVGRLALADPPLACQPLGSSVKGAIILVQRGNCSFTVKAAHVQAAGATAMLLFDTKPGCVSMGGDAHNSSSPAHNITIPCVSVNHQTASVLLQAAQGPTQVPVSLDLLQLSPLDAGSLLLWCVAVATVAGGAWWAGEDHLAVKRAQAAGRRPDECSALVHGPPPPESVTDITMGHAAGFILMASAVLLLLFFFLNKYLFYIMMGIFCFAASNSLTVLLAGTAGTLLPHLRDATWSLPCLGACPRLAVVAWPVAAVTTVVWAVFRHHSGAWVLQDLLGVALMLLVLRTLRLSSIRVACVLLPACFLYDIFWVFISPLFFGGQSVMVEVAEGGEMHESLPMLLKMPRLDHPGLGGYSMLGFGDIILPGLLVCYTRRLDIDVGNSLKTGYYLPTTVSYAVGLSLTYMALMFSWFGDQGQPALLYLVPCTLGTVLTLGAWRGQWALLFATSKKYRSITAEDHCSDPGSPGDDPHGTDKDCQLEGVSHRDLEVGLRDGVGSDNGERSPLLAGRGHRSGDGSARQRPLTQDT